MVYKRQAKALIRLRLCAGWSEPLMVAHTNVLEILFRGLLIFVTEYETVFCDAFDWRFSFIIAQNALLKLSQNKSVLQYSIYYK